MSKELSGTYQLVRFARDNQQAGHWNVTRFRLMNGQRIQTGRTCTINTHEDFMADEYWCDTGPGQEFLWRDCPKAFQAFLNDFLQNPDKRSSFSSAPD